MLCPSPIPTLRIIALTLSLAVLATACPHTSAQTPSRADFSDAVCPVVYQLDESPGTHGYHYIFFGNAFFINREGYLLTAAHVLSEFHDGGQPSVLLRLASAPPRMLKVTVVDVDAEHDVAILRVTPNPFTGPYNVLALPLAAQRPDKGQAIAVSALRPSHPRNPETYELPVTDTYSAVVLDYRSMSLTSESSRATAKENPSASQSPAATRKTLTDLFLFSHEVQLGQSGSPVVSANNGQVVGFIEGRWLHPAASVAKNASATPAPVPRSLTQGAAVPITYALGLLQRNHITWDGASLM
jgi:trypsin-like peptidase